MSGSNIFKISIYQAHFEAKKDLIKATTPRRTCTPNKSTKSKNSIFKQQSYNFQLGLPKIQSHKSTALKAQSTVIEKKKQAIPQQNETLQSHRSVASCRSHRKIIDCSTKPSTANKLERPQSAMIKKSRKRSWQTYNTKIPLFRQTDIILKSNKKLTDNEDQFVAFLKQKCTFVRIIKSKQQLQYQPISNEFTAKIYGRIQVNNKSYFIVQNFNNTSVANIIDSFGPCKESLVSKQIRSLVIGFLHFHQRGIIHNRINPQTIFMNKQGNFLIDFIKMSEKTLRQPQKQKYFHYFSPQFLIKNIVFESNDVWAIGCLTLQMLTGRLAESCFHPYNQNCETSPSSKYQDLKKLRQMRLKYKNYQRSQFCSDKVCKKAEEELSKKAKSFISACLRINYKVRIQLQMLVDHQFLRI